MRKPLRFVLLAAIAALIVVIPAVVFAALSSSKLDGFLQLRESVLVKLDQNALSLPAGVEHWSPPASRLSPTFPERQHIESVVNGGAPWSGDGHRAYALRLSGPLSERPVRDVAMLLEAHFAEGLQSFGLSSPVKGFSGFLGDGRATQNRWWRDEEGQMIVTFSVFVDRESKTAHVERFVHERFD
jgi:hypothetical protein